MSAGGDPQAVRHELASALGRRDEGPNIALAERLAAEGDASALAALVALLTSGTSLEQGDAIKVLYEVGARRPDAIVPHIAAFFALLAGRNNRNIWGALTALAAVTPLVPAAIAGRLEPILAAADRGSVIAKDQAIAILCALVAAGDQSAAGPLLERLAAAAANQFPMYAERAAAVLPAAARDRFGAILVGRLEAVGQPAKRRRIEKVLGRLGG